MKEGAFANPIQARAGQGYGNVDGGAALSSEARKNEPRNGGNPQNQNPSPQSENSQPGQRRQGLPATQGLVPTGPQMSSCPPVLSAPSLAACQGRNSDCWSVGMQD